MQRISLHVPAQFNDGTPVGTLAFEEIERRLDLISPGSTRVDKRGRWDGTDDGPGRIYYVLADDDGRALDLMTVLAEDLATVLRQDCVAIEVETVQLILAYPQVAAKVAG